MQSEMTAFFYIFAYIYCYIIEYYDETTNKNNRK